MTGGHDDGNDATTTIVPTGTIAIRHDDDRPTA